MSDRVVIRCPGCDNTLGVRRDRLGGQVQCPGCGTWLATRVAPSGGSASDGPASERRRSSGDKPSSRRRKGAGTSASAGASAGASSGSGARRKPSSKSKSARSRPAAAAGQNPSAKRRSSGTSKKRRPKPAPVEEEFLDDWGGDDYGYEEVSDDYSDAGDDLYGDDDYGESWLDDGGEADWNSPAALPSTPRKKKKSASSDTGTKKKKKKRKKSAAPGFLTSGNPLVWVGAGLAAGLVSFIMTVAVGYSDAWILLYLATILSGAIIGGAIRVTAGEMEGWAPGLVALGIAIPVIVVGRVGAFYVSPGMSEVFGEAVETSSESLARIEEETSPEGMIAHLVETEVSGDIAWMRGAGVTYENLYSDAWEDADWDEANDLSYQEQYSEVVWTEAERRWNALDDETRAARVERRRLDLTLSAGMLDDTSFARLVELQTGDVEMTALLVDEVESDEDWLKENSITTHQISRHWEIHSAESRVQDRSLPKIWEEASRRWAELDDDAKAARRAEIEENMKFQQQAIDDAEQFAGKFRIGAAIIAAFVSLLMPFHPIICTFSSMFLAFKLGAKMASG